MSVLFISVVSKNYLIMDYQKVCLSLLMIMCNKTRGCVCVVDRCLQKFAEFDDEDDFTDPCPAPSIEREPI